MSVASEIQRLQTAKAGLKTQIEAKGVSVSSNATLDTYPSLVSSIQTASFSGEAQDVIDGLASGKFSGPIIISSGESGNGFQLRNNAFSDCTGITSVNYYAQKYYNDVRLWDALFKNCKSLTAFTMSGPNVGLPMTIGGSTFEGCTGLTSFPYLEYAKSIGGSAFKNCPIRGCNIGSGCTGIGEEVFYYDNNVTGAFSGQNVTIPAGITALQGAFNVGTFQRTYATGFTMMGDISRLGNNYSTSNYCFFKGNSQCEEYDFTHNIIVPQRVPTNEFEGSKEGYRIVVPQVLYDKWLTTQNWPNFASHIVSAANIYNFYRFDYTTSNDAPFTLSDFEGKYSVSTSGYTSGEGGYFELYAPNENSFHSFYSRPSNRNIITSLHITSAFTFLPYQFASQWAALTGITIDEGVTRIETETFYGNTGLTSISLPNTLVEIGTSAFRDCAQLRTINIPDSVTTIKSEAFHYSLGSTGVDNGRHITIGSGITSIEAHAFRNNSTDMNSTTVVTIKATTPPTFSLTQPPFGGTNLEFYVPAESVDTYKAADGWSSYADVISAIAE